MYNITKKEVIIKEIKGIKLEIMTAEIFDEEVPAVRKIGDNKIYVPVKDVCRTLGMTDIQIRAQRRSIQNHENLSRMGTILSLFTTTGPKDTYCIKIEGLAIWMACFNTKAMKDRELAKKILFYQAQAGALLRKLFLGELQYVPGFEPHLEKPIQIQNSKDVNRFIFFNGDRKKIIQYNIDNCFAHTGYKPYEVKQKGKEYGLPYKDRSSAKSVIRKLAPERACGMSFTDNMVKNGCDPIKTMKVSTEKAVPLFKAMIEELNVIPAELGM